MVLLPGGQSFQHPLRIDPTNEAAVRKRTPLNSCGSSPSIPPSEWQRVAPRSNQYHHRNHMNAALNGSTSPRVATNKGSHGRISASELPQALVGQSSQQQQQPVIVLHPNQYQQPSQYMLPQSVTTAISHQQRPADLPIAAAHRALSNQPLSYQAQQYYQQQPQSQQQQQSNMLPQQLVIHQSQPTDDSPQSINRSQNKLHHEMLDVHADIPYSGTNYQTSPMEQSSNKPNQLTDMTRHPQKPTSPVEDRLMVIDSGLPEKRSDGEGQTTPDEHKTSSPDEESDTSTSTPKPTRHVADSGAKQYEDGSDENQVGWQLYCVIVFVYLF